MVPDTTIQIQLVGAGGPEKLERVEVALGPVPQGQVRVKVAAAGVNYPDLLLRLGQLPVKSYPHVLGFEVGGTIEATGPGVETPKPGTKVVVELPTGGGYASSVDVPASAVREIHSAVGFDEAVAVLTSGRTALLMLRHARVRAGETVFVPSALGGVGNLAVQLAHRLGARVLAGVGSAAKAQHARTLGADGVIDTGQPNWSDQIRSQTQGRGADVVFQTTNGGEGAKALAPLGRWVLFGADNVAKPEGLAPEQLRALIGQAQSLIGFALMRQPESVRDAAFDELLSLVERGELKPLIADYPLREAARAHADFEARRTVGKVILSARAFR